MGAQQAEVSDGDVEEDLRDSTEYVPVELFRFVQVDEVASGDLEGLAAVVAAVDR